MISDVESATDVGRARGIREARDLAGDRVRLILDSPSIEYWFLLHFERTARDFDSASEVIRELRKYIPEYSKAKGSVSWPRITEHTNKALDNAEWLRRQREASASNRPVADCDVLVKAIIAIGESQ